jgi:hypothetical protein
MTPELAAVVAGLTPVSLPEVEAIALLQNRFDRKYVLEPDLASDLVDLVGHRSSVLEIDQRRSFTYRSRYFDTAALDSYRGAASGRRTRFKVRTRAYEDHGTAVLEVKTRGPRGTTLKVRMAHDPDAMDVLSAEGAAFVDDHVDIAGLHERLQPVLTTRYHRTTLVDATDASRATIDQGLVCTGRGGADHPLVDRVVLETKSTGAATAIDRLLWARGVRPVRISKFGVGMALHDPTLPANRWNRTLRVHFGWEPERTPILVGHPVHQTADAGTAHRRAPRTSRRAATGARGLLHAR